MVIKTMCKSIVCPDRQKCYRYIGLPSEKQEYGYFFNINKKCCMFVNVIPSEPIVWDKIE